MKTRKFIKKAFIYAYRAIYGVSQKEAIEVYNKSSLEAILNIIKWYELLWHFGS